jgi:hypothetical protein
MPSGILYHIVLVRTEVSENISLPSSGFVGVIQFHSYVSVESLLISLSIEGYSLWSKNNVFWGDFTAVSVIDAFWDFVLCSSSSNLSFIEHTAFIFRVP